MSLINDKQKAFQWNRNDVRASWAHPSLWAPRLHPGNRAQRCSTPPAAEPSSWPYTAWEQGSVSPELEFVHPPPPPPPLLLQPGFPPERGCPPSCAEAVAAASSGCSCRRPDDRWGFVWSSRAVMHHPGILACVWLCVSPPYTVCIVHEWINVSHEAVSSKYFSC